MFWLIGLAVIVSGSLLQYRRFLRRCVRGTEIQPGIWRCSDLDSPVLIGLVHPRILLPEGLNEIEETSVLLHEQMHSRRKDPWIKLAAYALVCVYWFHPLVWAAFALMSQDMEMACDEAVIRRQDSPGKQAYSHALVELAAASWQRFPHPLNFARGSLRRRIENILNYKKLPCWAGGLLTMGLVVVLIVALFLGCVARPVAAHYGTPGAAYASLPAVEGFLGGYQTMDTIAALNFGAVIALNIRAKGIEAE